MGGIKKLRTIMLKEPGTGCLISCNRGSMEVVLASSFVMAQVCASKLTFVDLKLVLERLIWRRHPRQLVLIGFRYKVIQKHFLSSSTSTGVASIYFDHNDQQSQTPSMCIAGLLRQLEQQKENLTNSIQNAYVKFQPNGHWPDLRTLSGLLLDSASSFESTYIILDGLEESAV